MSPGGEGQGEGGRFHSGSLTTRSPVLPVPCVLNDKPANTGPAAGYQLAVVQRQRLGSYAARQLPQGKARPTSTSPGPELRFRVDLGAGVPADKNAQKPAISKLFKGIQSKKSAAFIPLHAHSYYSFLDSTLSVPTLVDLAVRHELPALALTDKNNLHGAIEFAQAAARAGIKAIIGAELNWHGHRLCVYDQNQTGSQNLCRLLNAVQKKQTGKQIEVTGGRETAEAVNRTPGHGITPLKRGVNESLRSPMPLPDGFGALRPDSTTGLIALSSSAELAQYFPDRFYLEIGSLEAYEKYSSRYSTAPSLHRSAFDSLPCVAAFPIHYQFPSDRWKYDIVQSIRTLTLLRQEHPEKRLDGEFHFRPPAEMQKLFGEHPELLAHSLELAERCDFEFSLGTPQFPGYTPPDGLTPAVFLRQLVMAGLQRRYPEKHLQLKAQLEEELAIITDVGYEEYFLVMWDILQECRRRGIEWITRGSAADSLACYCLEISGVCPIRFDLYFRRFLNKDRMALNKLPDIDVDFPHDRKDDVIDLIFEKYGAKQTAIVGGFSTFQSRSAFAEVAKVLGVSEFQVRRITERLPSFSRAGELAEAVAGSQECRDLPLHEEPYRSALQMAHFLDGFPRYPKMHPCGLVLSRQPMDEITPCFTSAKGYPTTHFDMDSVEAIGLIKMDILAQGGLAVMRDVKEMLRSETSKIQPATPNFQPPITTEHHATGDQPRSSLDCDVKKMLGKKATLALTPALSPGERETAPKFARTGKLKVGCWVLDVRVPGGEGRGEGGHFKLQSPTPNLQPATFDPRPGATGALDRSRSLDAHCQWTCAGRPSH